MEGGVVNIPIENWDWLIELVKKHQLNKAIDYWELSKDKKFSKTSRNNFRVLSWYKLFIWAGYRE